MDNHSNDRLAFSEMQRNADSITGQLVELKVFRRTWAIGATVSSDGARLPLVGEALVDLRLGSEYRFTGQWDHHPKYGSRFHVVTTRPHVQVDPEAIARHLQRHFTNCGPKTAQKVVAHYLEHDRLADLHQLLLNNPGAVPFAEIAGRQGVQPIHPDYLTDSIYHRLSITLAIDGVGIKTFKNIATWLAGQVERGTYPVDDAWQLFTSDPYKLIGQVRQYGFKLADKIAYKVGIGRNAPCRLSALAEYALNEGCEQEGHSWLSRTQFATKIVRIDPLVNPLAAIEAAVTSGAPIAVDGECYYPAYLRNAEIAVARSWARRAAGHTQPLSPLSGDRLSQEIAVAERTVGITLDDSQRQALAGLLSSACTLHSLTAGPGCGKTALMEMMLRVMPARAAAFCAPTGKAAKNLSARLKAFGVRAYTVNHLLGTDGQGGFEYTEHNLLPCSVCVMDETSMLDISLLSGLLAALPLDCHIIKLGDEEQLPSVGPGQVLRDALELPFNHHRLDKTHRNGGGIQEIVHQIRGGQCDLVDKPDVSFSHSLPPPTPENVAGIARMYKNAVQSVGIENVCLLTSRRKGTRTEPGWNSTYLNEYLREIFNPGGEAILSTKLRVGDRIVVKKNGHILQSEDDLGVKTYEYVVNGDSGTIDECHYNADRSEITYLILSLDDGRTLRYPIGNDGPTIDSVDLSYANTVHYAQGSEYQIVFFICTPGGPAFMHRGIVYTAASRAKVRLCIIGDDQTLLDIVNRPVPRRNSNLVKRFHEELAVLAPCGELPSAH
ncbi:ATP-dependent DNA helicase [Burkholderia sp. MBR-1]|uniref:ATP-dependent DNA helicase n=1 Tax=Burkholderia sp. MBR-1 TaxID=2732364 RepID=UPI0015EEF83D|nr:ATP-dependent RecD-like DNA helicase [Burkholderia sp. MBR-1]QMI49733.1 AAA family ATPase [Burkholderia sp. MBR-1]